MTALKEKTRNLKWLWFIGGAVYGVFLPYLILFSEGELPLKEENIQLVESVIVQASSQVIWAEIVTAKHILYHLPLVKPNLRHTPDTVLTLQ